MRYLAHQPRRFTAVLVTLVALAFSLAVIARPIGPARADDSQSVTIAQAATQAAETGQPVLATAETTETSSVVANPDGSLTATLGAGPLQEPDPSSSTGWAPIDLTLQHVDGTYAPAVSGAGTTFSDGGSGALATLDQGSTTYTENWAGTLPAPTVSGTTATYVNVLPNIDLVMTAQTTGFKQSFVVKVAPTQQLTLDVPLSLRGLTATVDDNGNLTVTDSHGDTVASSSTAVMYGAAMGPTGEPTISATVDTQVVNGQHGPDFEISPDPSFFSNPDLTYPVTIDPSPNLAVTTDTYVKQSTATTSYLTDNVLKSGSPDGTDVTRTLLDFPNVGSTLLTGGVGVQVVSSTLNLYETDSGSCTASEVDVYDPGAWVSTVTWNTQPAAETLYASTTAAHGYNSSCPNNWVNISDGGTGGHNLADLTQSWVDGSPNDGLLVKAASETSIGGYKKFKSTEGGANSPTLSINYNSVPSIDSMSAATTATTVTLHASYNTSGSGKIQYVVYDQAGDQVLTGDGSSVTAGTDSPYAFSLSSLEAGSSYTWQARWSATAVTTAYSAQVDGYAVPDSTDTLYALLSTNLATELIGFPGWPDVWWDCGASNSTIPATDVDTVGVSYLCQYSVVGSGTWHDIGTAPSTSCDDCTGTNYGHVRMIDICVNYGNESYLIRTHVDGWWINNGTRHDMTEHSGFAIRLDCLGDGPTQTAKLLPMVSVSGSTDGSGPSFSCGGSNMMNPADLLREVHISYVCQKRLVGTSTWYGVTKIQSCGDSGPDEVGTEYCHLGVNCSNIGTGDWDIRTKVDGWWFYGSTRRDQDAVYGMTLLRVHC